MDKTTTGIEDALSAVEQDADALLKALGTFTQQVRKAKSAAASGDIRELKRSVAASSEAADITKERLRNMMQAWTMDEKVYLESEHYAAELLEHANAIGLNMVPRDGQFLSYPSVVRVLAGDAALEINRKKFRQIRPSAVAAELKKLQSKSSGMKPEQFIEVLYRAYLLIAAGRNEQRSIVSLMEIHAALTLLPSSRDYSKQEFARDILTLDMSGVRSTRSAARISFPGSTGTKSGSALSTITPAGETRIYWGVEFT